MVNACEVVQIALGLIHVRLSQRGAQVFELKPYEASAVGLAGYAQRVSDRR